MKKVFSLIAVAAVMLTGLAGNALAYFEAGSLIRVVYQTNGDVEVLTDLGNGADLIASSNATVGTGTDAFSLSQFGGVSYGDLKVAYMYSPTITSTGAYTFSGPVDATITSGNRKGGSMQSIYTSFVSNYVGEGTATVVGSQADRNSYHTLFTGTNYAAFVSASVVEMSLADLATVGYVEQTLYTFSNANSVTTGVAVATIRTMADGSTVINPAAATVPIPASFLLFGSGLLGLFGIRRKNS